MISYITSFPQYESMPYRATGPMIGFKRKGENVIEMICGL